jgi:serine protease Do
MNPIDQTTPTNPTRKRLPRMLLAALATTTILTGAAFGTSVLASGAADAQTPPPISATVPANTNIQPGFADLVAKVKPAVVNIATTAKIDRADMQRQMPFNIPPGSPFADLFRQFERQQQRQRPEARHALGSGFIIDPAGYIVTNNHVIDGANKVNVTLSDGTSYPATVKGRDEKTDMALLKIDAPKPLPYVAFGDSSKAREGDWVIAVGNPFGLGGSVTAGIISAQGRNIHEGPYDDFLQIDAPINPGNSGGPLFDQTGHVVGIDTAIFSPSGGSVGIGFAIPSNLASKVVAQLREHGTVERGWLGVAMQPITPALAKALGRSDHEGVVVNEVQPNSPAAAAGLQQGDVITAVDGKTVTGPRELALTVAGFSKGTNAQLTIWRDGKERSVDVKIAAQPSEKTASAEESGTKTPVGLQLAPLSSAARTELGLDDNAKGVVVANVTPESRAAESGIQPGDVIVKVGNDAVKTPSDAVSRIRAAENEKKEAVPLLVLRDGHTYYLALQLAA